LPLKAEAFGEVAAWAYQARGAVPGVPLGCKEVIGDDVPTVARHDFMTQIDGEMVSRCGSRGWRLPYKLEEG
jgi:hypothetical protein